MPQPFCSRDGHESVLIRLSNTFTIGEGNTIRVATQIGRDVFLICVSDVPLLTIIDVGTLWIINALTVC